MTPLGTAPQRWGQLPRDEDSSPEMGTAPQRCLCQPGWGSHGVGFAAPAVHLLGTAANIPHFGFIPKNGQEDLLDPVVPVCQGRAGCGAGTARAVLSKEPSQGRVRMRMKVRTQPKPSGKQDGFAEAAPPSAGKSKQRQQSRWPRENLRRKGEINVQGTQAGPARTSQRPVWALLGFSRARHSERALLGTSWAETGTHHLCARHNPISQCGKG